LTERGRETKGRKTKKISKAQGEPAHYFPESRWRKEKTQESRLKEGAAKRIAKREKKIRGNWKKDESETDFTSCPHREKEKSGR